jgi:hypothetical protein
MSGCHVVGCNQNIGGGPNKGAADPYDTNVAGKMIVHGTHNQQGVQSGTEYVGDELFHMLTLKLSEKFKRIFYFKDQAERDLWYLRLKKATDEKPEVTDKYVLNEKIGEGSFGKVYDA